MKPGSTLFLKGVVICLGITVLVLCYLIAINLDNVGPYRLILLGMYVPAVPFFVALYQAMRLLSLIDKGKAFSKLSIRALNIIKYCALIISALYAAGMPYIYIVANKDDAPSVIVIGLVVVFASIVVATFAALLQRLLQDAWDIKSENDLTV